MLLSTWMFSESYDGLPIWTSFSLSQLCLGALSGPMSAEVFCWEIILGAARATGKSPGVRRKCEQCLTL